MKGLIVSKNELIRGALEAACTSLGYETVAADHNKALEMFLADEPDFLIICDYEEKEDKDDFPGTITYRDIKNSATSEKIIRGGFSSYDYEDYLRFPFLLEDLKNKIERR